jgi:putative oxidoreductase
MKSTLTKLSVHVIRGTEFYSQLTSAIVVIGRICFSLIFIAAGLKHFTTNSIATAASHGVPLASIAVPISGLMALAGGLSILLGYRARLGAWLIVLFLIPTTLAMHNFWAIADPVEAEMQMIMFMKNVSMLGGALLISHFGAGPGSIDARREKRNAGQRSDRESTRQYQAAGSTSIESEIDR